MALYSSDYFFVVLLHFKLPTTVALMCFSNANWWEGGINVDLREEIGFDGSKIDFLFHKLLVKLSKNMFPTY